MCWHLVWVFTFLLAIKYLILAIKYHGIRNTPVKGRCRHKQYAKEDVNDDENKSQFLFIHALKIHSVSLHIWNSKHSSYNVNVCIFSSIFSLSDNPTENQTRPKWLQYCTEPEKDHNLRLWEQIVTSVWRLSKRQVNAFYSNTNLFIVLKSPSLDYSSEKLFFIVLKSSSLDIDRSQELCNGICCSCSWWSVHFEFSSFLGQLCCFLTPLPPPWPWRNGYHLINSSVSNQHPQYHVIVEGHHERYRTSRVEGPRTWKVLCHGERGRSSRIFAPIGRCKYRRCGKRTWIHRNLRDGSTMIHFEFMHFFFGDFYSFLKTLTLSVWMNFII